MAQYGQLENARSEHLLYLDPSFKIRECFHEPLRSRSNFAQHPFAFRRDAEDQLRLVIVFHCLGPGRNQPPALEAVERDEHGSGIDDLRSQVVDLLVDFQAGAFATKEIDRRQHQLIDMSERYELAVGYRLGSPEVIQSLLQLTPLLRQ